MYTLASPLTPYVPPAWDWHALLSAHGAYGGVDAILLAYDRWCSAYRIDTNLALAQACHEAAWFTSWRWVHEWNPAGLGITADNTPPNPFASLDEGIRAHIEHLCCYVYTLADCPVDHGHMVDRRHFFHDGLPAVSDLVRLPRRAWANPGVGYAASIVAIANSVGGGTPLADPFDRVHWSADIGPARALADIRWFVVHDTEGYFVGDEQVLTSPNPPVESAHFLIGRESGQCVYMVPLDKTAWTAGNDTLGALAVQVEMSGFAGNGEGYTAYQYSKLAEIYRWCVAQGMAGVPPVYLGLHPKDDDGGWLPDDPGIIGHAGVPDGHGGWGGVSHHTDPGEIFDWALFLGQIVGQPVPPSPPDNHVNGHVLAGGFRALWDAIPSRLQVFGLPLSEEYGGLLGALPVTVQDFERVQMVYDVSTPEPFRVRVPLRTEKVRKVGK